MGSGARHSRLWGGGAHVAETLAESQAGNGHISSSTTLAGLPFGVWSFLWLVLRNLSRGVWRGGVVRLVVALRHPVGS